MERSVTLGMDESGYQEVAGDPMREAPGAMTMAEERVTGAGSTTAGTAVVTNGTSDAASAAEAPAEQSLMQQLLDDPSHDYRSL